MTVAVVTATYGGYDRPKPIGWTDDSARGYLWTDDDQVARDASVLGWYPVLDEDPACADDGDDHMSAMLKAKFIKTHTWAAAHGADVVIWLDASMTVVEPNFIQLALDALGNDDVSLTPHPLRRCIRPEALVTAALARYSDCDPIKQVNYYDSIGHPRDWGLFASGAFVVRNNELTRKWGEHWWYECVKRTYQDQLSLPVITRIMEQRGLRWNQNMPWARWWGITEHGL